MAPHLDSLRLRGASGIAVTRLIAAILSTVLLFWAGVRVSRAGAARRADVNRIESTLASFDAWRRRFEPATAAESLAWRRTLMELQSLGVIGDERLALTQSIGRAAEEAGLRDVRVMIEPPDTTGSHARLSTGGVRRREASFGLRVECRGNLQSMVNFLGSLPAAVAPTSLNLVRQDGNARHRLSLAVYELELSNGPISLTSPQERGDPHRLSVPRVRS